MYVLVIKDQDRQTTHIGLYENVEQLQEYICYRVEENDDRQSAYVIVELNPNEMVLDIDNIMNLQSTYFDFVSNRLVNV